MQSLLNWEMLGKDVNEILRNFKIDERRVYYGALESGPLTKCHTQHDRLRSAKVKTICGDRGVIAAEQRGNVQNIASFSDVRISHDLVYLLYDHTKDRWYRREKHDGYENPTVL